ncbi:hypothetical protein SCLCIDRAFT_1212945 [Scleroderma citrinum Foug A]|uniref:Uncharacterized protein n=1 Tax=Scleroderma citrinum Foug A TaxID=1036808 RepID=A0A0C3AIY2_9AGAM|nr:hypothetical protein SCLCIDRAFT_1212945 [Scleroderma citrinum Foug A]
MGHSGGPPTRCVVFTCVRSAPIDLRRTNTSSFLAGALGNGATSVRYLAFCFLNKC